MNRDHLLVWTHDVWNYFQYIDVRLRSYDDPDAEFDLLDRQVHTSGIRLTKRNSKEFFSDLNGYLDVTRRRDKYRHCLTVYDHRDRTAYYYIDGVQLSHGKKLVDDKGINDALAEMCEELDPSDMVYWELERRANRQTERKR